VIDYERTNITISQIKIIHGKDTKKVTARHALAIDLKTQKFFSQVKE